MQLNQTNTQSYQKVVFTTPSSDSFPLSAKSKEKQKQKIDNTMQLDLLNQSKPVCGRLRKKQTSLPIQNDTRKRKRIIIEEDEVDTNERQSKRPNIVIQRCDETDDSDVDEHGNIKGLISYSEDDNDMDMEDDESVKRPHSNQIKSTDLLNKISEIDDDDINSDDEEWIEPQTHDTYEKEYRKYIKLLSKDEQDCLTKMEKEIMCVGDHRPWKYQILTMNAPLKIKYHALEKLKILSTLDKSSSEYYTEEKVVSNILKVPWGKYVDLPVTKNDGKEKMKAFLLKTKRFLDTVSYGQHMAKSSILLELGRYLENPNAKGFVMGIKGRPGTGKTTLINDGLAKLLNRPFYRIDLGGVKHSDTLLGSRKVFSGSDVGDIAKLLIDGKCMNPIILFDELDKVSMTEYGNEVLNVLNDLTDPTRNTAILEQLLGVHMDLSRAIIIFTYNSPRGLPTTLTSRIHEIEIEPYSIEDKVEMTTRFILPRMCQTLGFNINDIILTPEAIRYLIENYVNNEVGVRELERKIKSILLKLNWCKLVGSDDNMNDDDNELLKYHCKDFVSFKFPLQLTPLIIDQVLDKKVQEIDKDNGSDESNDSDEDFSDMKIDSSVKKYTHSTIN